LDEDAMERIDSRRSFERPSLMLFSLWADVPALSKPPFIDTRRIAGASAAAAIL
jgi:hypothetical protein